MLEELAEIIVASSLDIAVDKAARQHRWVRILRALTALLFFALIAAVVYVTFTYS